MDEKMRRRHSKALPRFDGETLKLVETQHGYCVRAKRGSGVLFAVKWALRAVSAVLVAAAISVWVFPQLWFFSDATVITLVASAILAFGEGGL